MMASPLRILLWSPKGAGLHYGGPGMNAFRLYSKATPNQVELTLVHGLTDHERLNLFREQRMLSSLTPSPRSQMEFIARGRRWISENSTRFDVFHGLQGFELTVQPALAARKRGLPAVVKLASHRSDLAGKPGWKALLRFAERRRVRIRQLDAIIAISGAIAEELLEYGVPEDKIARIPNGVDTDLFRPRPENEQPRLRESLGLLDIPTVLFVGALVERKNPALLITMVHELRQRGRDVQLVLAGPELVPAYSSHLRSLVHRYGLESLVTFTGHVHDTASLYAGADLFALPSSNEGMPNALLEAMASGLPSLSTNISGVTDVITDGQNGRILPATVGDFTDAVVNYLDDIALYSAHGVAARTRIMSKFSAALVLEQHLQLFRKIAGKY